MSGLTLAAGPRPAAAAEAKEPNDDGGLLGGLMGSVRTIELQLVAFIAVFSASGLVPLLDLVFPLFASFYFFILSRRVFPSYPLQTGRMEVFHGSRMFQLYVIAGTFIGLFVPLGYVLGGFARGDQHAVRAATPHLFLLSAQVLSENIISRISVFSPPVRVLIPLLYTTRRIFTLVDWLEVVFFHSKMPSSPTSGEYMWIWFGRSLAAANFVYFNINLFFFLIPRFLPRAFERYFAAKAAATGHHSESATNTDAKAAHDKENKKAQ